MDTLDGKRTCCLFGAGDYGDMPRPELPPDALVLAVDGGFAQLAHWGLAPDLAVGDFDSLGRVPAGVPVIRHPAEKDDTDMLLAVREGLARGCERFFLYGGLGARLDHTVGNLHILAFLAGQGREGFLLGEGTAVTAVCGGALAFSPQHTGTLSVFAWGGAARGVTLAGVRYPLEDAELTCDFPLGVSNEFLGRQAVVRVRHGTLLAMWTQAELFPRRVADPPR